MNVKCFYHTTGLIIGDVQESLESCLVVKNPCTLHITQSNIALTPLLGMSKDDLLYVPLKEVLFNVGGDQGLFDPVDGLVDYYKKTFEPSLIATPPEKKIIV